MKSIPGRHEQLSAILAEIYDAALDPSRWPAVTERIADLFQGVGVLFA